MNLMPGRNNGMLKVQKPWREVWQRDIVIQFNIHFYNQSSRFIAFDFDDVMSRKEHGYLLPDYEINENKPEAIEMLEKIYRNGYTPVYLTSRPYTQSEEIRYHLFERMRRMRGYSVPETPLFMSPRAFKDSVTNVYKTMYLINIAQLFYEPQEVFQGAYGHLSIDSEVFVDAGINSNYTWLIDDGGKMYNMETKEETSYAEQAEIVDINYPRMPDNVNIHIALTFAKLLFQLAQVCHPEAANVTTTTMATTTTMSTTIANAMF